MQKKIVVQNRIENVFFLVPTVHYFSAGRNSSFSYYVFVCLEYHVVIVCLCAHIMHYISCMFVCLFVCQFLSILLKYYCIVFNHCVRNMFVC